MFRPGHESHGRRVRVRTSLPCAGGRRTSTCPRTFTSGNPLHSLPGLPRHVGALANDHVCARDLSRCAIPRTVFQQKAADFRHAAMGLLHPLTPLPRHRLTVSFSCNPHPAACENIGRRDIDAPQATDCTRFDARHSRQRNGSERRREKHATADPSRPRPTDVIFGLGCWQALHKHSRWSKFTSCSQFMLGTNIIGIRRGNNLVQIPQP